MKTRKTCSRGGCDRPVKAHELCQRHYDRERNINAPRHRRHREDRILASRARNRALSELARRHRAEFDQLWAEALTRVQAENAELHRVAAANGAEVTTDRQIIRLKRGPANEDETTVDRIDLTPRCPQCDTYHATGHRCLHCGALPSRAIVTASHLPPILVPAGMTDERIAAIVANIPDDDDPDEDDDDVAAT